MRWLVPEAIWGLECGSMGIPSWRTEPDRLIAPRDPKDNSRQKNGLDYWIWLAKLAEKGKISCIFFADNYARESIVTGSRNGCTNECIAAGDFEGHEAAFFRGGSNSGQQDPTIWISAMAAVSNSVAFGITGSSSYLTVSFHTSSAALS